MNNAQTKKELKYHGGLVLGFTQGNRTGKNEKSSLFIRFWWKFAHICKIEKNGVTVMNLFPIFFIENEIFTENVKKGSAVQPTLILISVEAELCALQNHSVFFF